MRRYLWFLPFLVALVLRLVFNFMYVPHIVGDQPSYIAYAHFVAQGSFYGTTSAYWPPIYPLFLGLFFALGFHQPGYLIIRLVQAVLSSFTVLFFQKVTEKIFAKLASFLTGLGLAIYPPLIFYSGQMLSETLYFFLVGLGLYLLFRNVQNPKDRRSFVGAGIFLGLSALTRPVSLPIPFLAFLVYWGYGLPFWASVRKSIGLILLLGVTLIPWTVRNALVMHAFVPIDINDGINFLIAHNPKADGTWVSVTQLAPLADHVTKERAPNGLMLHAYSAAMSKAAYAYAFHYMAQHPHKTWANINLVQHWFWHRQDPTVLGSKRLHELLRMFYLPFFSFLWLRNLFLLGLLVTLAYWRKFGMLLLYVAIYNFVIDLLYFMPIYRMAIEPFLWIWAGGGLARIYYVLVGAVFKKSCELK